MMTKEIRQQKKEDLDNFFYLAATQWEQGQYEDACRTTTRMRSYSDSVRGLDSELFWYGMKLSRRYAEFIVSESPSFQAWAVGQACSALRAAA
jgi:hypothetical protein